MTELKEILSLSVNERIHLVQTIWDSIAEDSFTDDVPDEHKIILDERLKAHEENPNNIMSWEEVKAHIRKLE
ncbi:MAG: addiction module protein [Bacteroidales bacterium]|nr:addiction module protein [Bacteroidales bacterium]MCF8457612.1 addiction module protein [Bacteroidales bacterium]